MKYGTRLQGRLAIEGRLSRLFNSVTELQHMFRDKNETYAVCQQLRNTSLESTA